MKPCPYCAETIQDDAIRCRFCFKDLPHPSLNPRIVRDSRLIVGFGAAYVISALVGWQVAEFWGLFFGPFFVRWIWNIVTAVDDAK